MRSMKCQKLRTLFLWLLLVVSLSSYGQNAVPPAIQTLKKAGMTVFPLGEGKWQTTVNGKVRVFNDDASVFGEFTSVSSFNQHRMVVTKGVITIEGTKPTELIVGWVRENDTKFSPYLPVKKRINFGSKGFSTLSDWDILDEEGKSILKFPIDGATIFDEGLCAVKVNGKYGFIDLNGNMVCKPKFDYAYKFFGNYGVIEDKYQNHVGIINKEFEILLPVSKEFISVRFFVKEHKGCKGLSLGTKGDVFYEVEHLVKCYFSNERNLKKALKEYDKTYRTTSR